MSRSTRFATAGLVIASLLVGGVAGAAIAAFPSASDTNESTASASPVGRTEVGALEGEWRMTSLETGTDGDLQAVPYSGQIVIGATGRVAVQAMNPDSSAPDTEFTVDGYEAWAGRATVDQAARTFVARVDSSVARDMIGTDQARRFEVTGDTLVLTPADGSGSFRATYQRY